MNNIPKALIAHLVVNDLIAIGAALVGAGVITLGWALRRLEAEVCSIANTTHQEDQ